VKLFRLAEESDRDLATFITLSASSGARRGEMVALRWKDLDLDGGTLSIERGMVLVGGELIEQGTKTHQSRRMTLDERTIANLRQHRSRVDEKAKLAGCAIESESFVFSHVADGSVPQESAPSVEFDAAVAHYKERFSRFLDRTAGNVQDLGKQFSDWLKKRPVDEDDVAQDESGD
jgi:integrase